MKLINTKRVLKFDVGMQISLIVATVLFAFLTPKPEWAFMTFYFGLGAFQLISFFTHLKRRLKKRKLIRTYALGILWALILGVVSCSFFFITDVVDLLFGYLVLMLVAGPVLALMYLILSFKDLGDIQAKINEL